MKRVFASLFALALAAPAWSQEPPESTPPGDNGPAAADDGGPSEADIDELLDLLDSDETEADDTGTGNSEAGADEAGGLPLRGDDGGEIALDSDAEADGAADLGEDDNRAADGQDAPAATDSDDTSEDVTDEPETLDSSPDDETAPGDGDPAGTADESGEPDGNADAGDNDPAIAEDETNDTGSDRAGQDETPPGPATGDDDANEDGEAGEDGHNTTPEESTDALVDVGIISPSTPFLTSTEYADVRPASAGEPIALVWQVETFTPEGQRVGEADTRTIILAPDFVRYERGGRVSINDFLTDRHLELDLEAETLRNTAFAAEIRRRLDTYLALSQGGRREQIPFGEGRSFARFWLEAAMGIRRDPVSLDRTYSDDRLDVENADGEQLLMAQFTLPETDDEVQEEDTAEESADADAADGIDPLLAAATPIDLASGESVVFNPGDLVQPINVNLGDAPVNFPDSTPAEQAQAEMFRRWMRHALPLHPDVLAALEGAPSIPDQFAYFVISPESPDGRREIWTLESRESLEPGFRLEPGLSPAWHAPDIVGERIAPAAEGALDDDAGFSAAPFMAEINAYREAGDRVGAYLAAIQEQHHNGPCPAQSASGDRPVCGELAGLMAGGIGEPAFEALFAAMVGEAGSGNEDLVASVRPYLENDDLAGAAARILAAEALLDWAARDPEGPPADLDPMALYAEAIELDPLAGAAYWKFGNALLVLRNPLGAWTLFDIGRSILPAGNPQLLEQVDSLETRLRQLAPEFYLPR
jgi:hypothetical protein